MEPSTVFWEMFDFGTIDDRRVEKYPTTAATSFQKLQELKVMEHGNMPVWWVQSPPGQFQKKTGWFMITGYYRWLGVGCHDVTTPTSTNGIVITCAIHEQAH